MRSSSPSPLLDSVRTTLGFGRWAAGLVALGILVSGATVVKPDEVALVLRFGRLTGQTRADQIHGPWLLLALPYPIDEVVRVPVKRIQETRIDVLTSGAEVGGGLGAAGFGPRRGRPERRGVRSHPDPGGDDDRLGPRDGKKELGSRALERAQARLDADGAWVRLVALEFTAIRPPSEVASVFDDVQSAFVERQTRVGQAWGYREQSLPRATAEAQAAIRDAEADAAARFAAARGAAAAFLAIQAEYRRNPAVVRQRLYREAMEQVFAAVGDRVLVPPGVDGGRLLIPGDGGSSPDAGPEQSR